MDDTAPHNLDRRSTTRDAMLSDCGNLQSNAKGAPRDLCTQNGRRSPTEELARAREGNLPERMRDVSVSSTLPTGELDAVKKWHLLQSASLFGRKRTKQKGQNPPTKNDHKDDGTGLLSSVSAIILQEAN